MRMQKYERGNLVTVLCEGNEKAVIEGSYGDLYGTKGTGGRYSVIFIENGNSLAWVDERDMVLIDQGGEYLFQLARENKDKVIKKYTDLEYIKENWSKENVNSITIRCLFEKIGFRSSFERNGEFFVLFSDWAELYPLFDTIVTKPEFKEVELVLNKDIPYSIKENIRNLHVSFHG
jgi:hypothetical protein